MRSAPADSPAALVDILQLRANEQGRSVLGFRDVAFRSIWRDLVGVDGYAEHVRSAEQNLGELLVVIPSNSPKPNVLRRSAQSRR